ncbi:hypothetical protein [Burkholderia sp. Z1]|uniref:hypothetical protein n=1 Tax=Burkholderia sp. Z1 TaxID=2759039 RepID=UPI0018695734|nr:hypothetical protein [Burkholderia sp. Z1]
MRIYQFVSTSIIGIASVVVARAEGMCTTKEVAIFNCELEKSVSSLCQSTENGVLIYRNGVDGKVNFQTPGSKQDAKDLFFLSYAPYAGGGEAHIRFYWLGRTYYLYDRVIKGDGGPMFSSGISIYKRKEKISNCSCGNDASIRAIAYQSIARETYRSIGAR